MVRHTGPVSAPGREPLSCKFPAACSPPHLLSGGGRPVGQCVTPHVGQLTPDPRFELAGLCACWPVRKPTTTYVPSARCWPVSLARDHFHVLSQIRRRGGLSWWPGRYSNAYFYPPHSTPLLAHHFASNLIAPAILKEERASAFRRRLLSYSCIPSPSSCPTRSFPNMPLAPSYESVYTTLAHNRRTTRATRPAPRNESCVACVCGTPGSLNTRTQSFLQFSRTSDACYLRLVSVGTRWSRWCPAGTHHRTGSMSGGQSGRRGAACCSSSHFLTTVAGRSCSARNGASRLILI